MKSAADYGGGWASLSSRSVIELLGTAARLGEPEQHVARLFRERAPLRGRELRRALRHALGDAHSSPRACVERPSLERRDRMAGALGEGGERLAVNLEIAGPVHREVTDREPLRARHRGPRLERQLEPSEVELAPHRQRDELQRAVQVTFELEAQVHAAPIRRARGW